MKKLTHILLLSLVFGNSFRAQQDAMFTHNMFNTLWLNPAYAGTREALTITGINRSQWVGFDGAPMVQSLTMHSPVFNDKIGMGFTFLNDKIGPTKSTFAAIDFAYHVKLNEKSKLGFGIKGLINMYSNNISSLTLAQSNDAVFAENFRAVLPNAGAGLYYYHEKFYAGFSTPKLLQNTISNTSTKLSREQRHYYLIAGSVFNLNENLKLNPGCFIKITNGAPIQTDLTARFILKDKLSLGCLFRTRDAAGILIGYNFTNQFTAGYSFDFSIANTTGKYNSGSHEIMLRYDLIFKSKTNVTSPRNF